MWDCKEVSFMKMKKNHLMMCMKVGMVLFIGYIFVDFFRNARLVVVYHMSFTTLVIILLIFVVFILFVLHRLKK